MPSLQFLVSAPHISLHPASSESVTPLFTIIIPSWNSLSFLKMCVESIQKNSRYQHQIISLFILMKLMMTQEHG